MITQDYLKDLKGLVKNRLGPYHIVVRGVDKGYNEKYVVSCTKDEFYDSTVMTCIGPKEHALNYDETEYVSGLFKDLRLYRSRGIPCAVFLTTAAGDLFLDKDNFKSGVLRNF